MKNPAVYFSLLAVLLLLLAYLPIGLPLEAKILVSTVIGFAGAFCLGITKARAIYAVPLTTVSTFLCVRLPWHPEVKIPAKPDIYIAALLGLFTLLVVCLMLFGLGRLVRFALARRMNSL